MITPRQAGDRAADLAEQARTLKEADDAEFARFTEERIDADLGSGARNVELPKSLQNMLVKRYSAHWILTPISGAACSLGQMYRFEPKP